MSRPVIVGVGTYMVLVASLATPLYEPLATGRDDAWTVLVVLVAAHVGVGAATRRGWVLLAPVVLALLGFVLGGAQGLAWLMLIFEAPVLIAATGLGWFVGHRARGRWSAVAAASFVVAALPALWAALETVRRGSELPRSAQAQLPIALSLGNLCPNSETPGALRRRLRRQAERLIVELRRRPNDLVTYTYYFEDGEEQTKITIRDLAEEQLRDLDDGRCAPILAGRIRAALR